MNKFEIGSGIIIGTIAVLWPNAPYWAEYTCVIIGLLLMAHGALGGRIEEAINNKEPLRTDFPGFDIVLHEGVPYEAMGESQGKALSIIRIGIKNTGDSPISNCKVYIDGINPVPAKCDTPIVLKEGLNLPVDFPEVLVDIASQREDMNRYRFTAAAEEGASDEPSDYLDDETPRIVMVKAESAECQRNASFKIWSDDRKRMHIRLIGHVE